MDQESVDRLLALITLCVAVLCVALLAAANAGFRAISRYDQLSDKTVSLLGVRLGDRMSDHFLAASALAGGAALIIGALSVAMLAAWVYLRKARPADPEGGRDGAQDRS